MSNKFLLLPITIVCFHFCIGFNSDCTAQEPTAEQTKQISEVKSFVDEAGGLFKSGNYRASGKKVKAAKSLMSELVASGNESILKQLEGDYARIEKAQELLTAKKQKFEPMVPLKEMGQHAKPKNEAGRGVSENESKPAESENFVSFTKDVAPILVQHCGKCHVKSAKGGFSAVSFTAIKQGSKKRGKVAKVFTAGEPAKSSLYKLIETGNMPPKSKNFPPEELKTIKDWISQGAKYDGAKEKDKLMDYVKTTDSQGGRQGRDQ